MPKTILNILGRCLLCEERRDHCLLARREGRLVVLCRGCTNPPDDHSLNGGSGW